ncbi:hypothetical protein [Streptomyces poonensis]|uniref:Uncharacterized protein n=1 Tax=Streptomyces poonensis TaxID=68255 RepID=A0A918UM75_9ACTN|nr:hypothetical protein [Streptomyces poonensis]GGZ20634.1 hypothetical protein GCM10010365_46180 [Streptomyces poonensis]
MKDLLYILGLFLVGMAFVAIRSAWRHDYDPIELLTGAAFFCGAIAAWRKAGRIMNSQKSSASRPKT